VFNSKKAHIEELSKQLSLEEERLVAAALKVDPAERTAAELKILRERRLSEIEQEEAKQAAEEEEDAAAEAMLAVTADLGDDKRKLTPKEMAKLTAQRLKARENANCYFVYFCAIDQLQCFAPRPRHLCFLSGFFKPFFDV
jgi:hypothetical protein